jgi:hypothetical protein
MYTEFTAGNKEYKLRLNTRAVIALEKQIGCNPLSIFMGANGTQRMPTITEMVLILHSSLQALEHGITLEATYDIFDAYLADGHTELEFVPVIMDIYKVSGLMPRDEEKTEKN